MPGRPPAHRSHRAPRQCPVCAAALVVSRLSCDDCGTELSGSFEPCEFCALSDDEREQLRVFLASRGNMKELERHLGVSYPTARARFDDLLARLGLAATTGADTTGGDDPTVELLESLQRGEITVEEADHRLV